MPSDPTYNLAVPRNRTMDYVLDPRHERGCIKGHMTDRKTPPAEHLRRASRLLPAFAILLATIPAFASKSDSVPDWVRTAAQQKLPEYSNETNAVVLLDDTTYTVAPDGSAIEHHRQVLKILRPQGRKEAIVEVPFDK